MRNLAPSFIGILAGMLIALPALAQVPLTPREIASTAESAVVRVRALMDGRIASEGSGFFIRADGVLVTNLHVVEGAEALQVEIPGGEVFDNVFFVAADERRDIVVLRIPVSGVSWLSVASEAELAVGDPVYVMGHPRGFAHTFSDGIVSAKRTIEGVSYVQITAPISPGSSGGPVLDERGRAIGVATLSHSEAQNLNMAVPARHASDLLALAQAPQPFHEVASRFSTAPAAPPANTGTGRTSGSSSGATSEMGSPSTALSDLHPAAQRMARDVADRFEAASEWEQTVIAILVFAVDAAARLNFDRQGDLYLGSAQEGDWIESTVLLPRGSYMITGACDEDCHDMDLEIMRNGRSVAEDIRVRDDPVISFEVPVQARYTVRARVYDCETGLCYFGYQVLRRHN